ncbi:GNAT family N-acetyltransferase [Flavobacterium sp. SUN046]|uniref:GNAT family N-acetyltransferase n=1 Tax=Flavobacterium sp. SUN046 TaxID=3002440 RepID=UPI002DB9FACF|nr:GNAT family N-acetyltransferase [Flavobacterium sp. SUN046]MEC4050361.1 GNAT family N-acetyltransferase [Flavobacterium sp. SUN046]
MTRFKLLEASQIALATQLMQEFYAIDHYPIDPEVTKTLFEVFINNEQLGRIWLIYSNEEVVGYVMLNFLFSFEFQGRIAFMDELYLKESARGKGLGQQAVQFIKEQAKLLGVKLIYLEVENHNEKAQKLYLANDFVTHHRKLLKHKLD